MQCIKFSFSTVFHNLYHLVHELKNITVMEEYNYNTPKWLLYRTHHIKINNTVH